MNYYNPGEGGGGGGGGFTMRDFTVSVPNQRAVLFDRYRYE